jgi:uncharacterized delta-60 repeat protein
MKKGFSLLAIAYLGNVEGYSSCLDKTFNGNGVVISTVPNSLQVVTKGIDVKNGNVATIGITILKTAPHRFVVTSHDTNGKQRWQTITAGTTGVGDSFGAAIAYQKDDSKLVAVGATYKGTRSKPFNYDFMIARYNEDGGLDQSFGIKGIVNIDFGNKFSDIPEAVITLPKGDIVVAGKSQSPRERYRCGVARLDSTGKVLGTLQVEFGDSVDECTGVAAQKDGKIVLVGTTSNSDERNFAIARLTENGNLDTNFGKEGKVVQRIFGKDFASAVAIQPIDQKIIVAGAGSDSGLINVNLIVLRYSASGVLDTTFGKNGYSFTGVGSMNSMIPSNILVDLQNNILVGATLMSVDFIHTHPVVARLTSAGVLDKTVNFGKGYVIQSFAAIEHDQSNSAGIALETNGNVLLAATIQATNDNDGYIGVARLNCFSPFKDEEPTKAPKKKNKKDKYKKNGA